MGWFFLIQEMLSVYSHFTTGKTNLPYTAVTCRLQAV
jgi:hypothetical protein